VCPSAWLAYGTKPCRLRSQRSDMRDARPSSPQVHLLPVLNEAPASARAFGLIRKMEFSEATLGGFRTMTMMRLQDTVRQLSRLVLCRSSKQRWAGMRMQSAPSSRWPRRGKPSSGIARCDPLAPSPDVDANTWHHARPSFRCVSVRPRLVVDAIAAEPPPSFSHVLSRSWAMHTETLTRTVSRCAGTTPRWRS